MPDAKEDCAVEADGDHGSPFSYSRSKWFALPLLMFLSFFFIKFLYVRPPAWEIALSAVAVGIFLAAYARAFAVYDRPRDLRLPTAVIFAIGVLLAPLNSGANIFITYSAWFVGRAYRTGVAIALTVGMCATVLALTVVFALPASFYGPGIIVTLALGLMSSAVMRTEQAQRALAKSRQEAQQLARVAERERIARDLHDTVGHTLSVVAMKSELAARLVERDPAQAREEIDAVGAIAREALSEVREVVSGYRSLGLNAELDSLVTVLRQSGLDVTSDIQETPMSPRAETAVALFFREAATNVLRHADANSCRIELQRNGAGFVAAVHDDGVGIGASTGNGLTGMRERIEELGGSLEVMSEGGTLLRARIPAIG